MCLERGGSGPLPKFKFKNSVRKSIENRSKNLTNELLSQKEHNLNVTVKQQYFLSLLSRYTGVVMGVPSNGQRNHKFHNIPEKKIKKEKCFVLNTVSP